MHTRYVENEFDNCLYDYVVYTDGGYSQVKDIGAFAFVILDSKCETVILAKSWKIEKETNNRAELKAIMSALYKLPEDAKNVCVISDSQYALKTISGVWGRKTNLDLFDWYDKWEKEHDIKITYKWERGHSGNKWNELCDTMCNDAAGMDLNAEFEKFKRYKKQR